MLDLKFKNLCLIFFFSGHEEGVVLAKAFHRKFSYFMVLNVAQIKVIFARQTITQDCMDIFEPTANTSEREKNFSIESY